MADEEGSGGGWRQHRRRHSLATSTPGREALASPVVEYGNEKGWAMFSDGKGAAPAHVRFSDETAPIDSGSPQLSAAELASGAERSVHLRLPSEDDGGSDGERQRSATMPSRRHVSRSMSSSSLLAAAAMCSTSLGSSSDASPSDAAFDWRAVLLRLRIDVDGLPLPSPQLAALSLPRDENEDMNAADDAITDDDDQDASHEPDCDCEATGHTAATDGDDEECCQLRSPVPLPPPPSRSALKSSSRARRSRIKFASELDVVELEETYYPSPKDPRDYPRIQHSPPPPQPTMEQKRDVRIMLRALVQKHQPFTYGMLLQLAIGKFCMSEDLPPYVEDFVNWVGKKRWSDPASGESLKLSWVDRRWLMPIIEQTWGVQIKYFPTIIL